MLLLTLFPSLVINGNSHIVSEAGCVVTYKGPLDLTVLPAVWGTGSNTSIDVTTIKKDDVVSIPKSDTPYLFTVASGSEVVKITNWEESAKLEIEGGTVVKNTGPFVVTVNLVSG